MLGLSACGSSSNNTAKDAAAGAGGKGGTGGVDASTGGTGGGGGLGGQGGGIVVAPCTPIVAMAPLLTDFSGGDTFGDFISTPSGTAEAYGGLTTSTADGNWHVTGTFAGPVGSAAWFIDFAGCPVDLSQYQGIQFAIGGNVGPSSRVTMQVFTGEDNFVAVGGMPPSDSDLYVHSTCTWTTNMYVECVEPSRNIMVPTGATTAAPATVSFNWTQFTGGRPRSTPDPKLITRLQFLPVAPPTGADASGMYDIDVVIDDIKLVPFPSDGGVDGAVDAPTDAPTDTASDGGTGGADGGTDGGGAGGSDGGDGDGG
jgi:hypothetical protein